MIQDDMIANQRTPVSGLGNNTFRSSSVISFLRSIHHSLACTSIIRNNTPFAWWWKGHCPFYVFIILIVEISSR